MAVLWNNAVFRLTLICVIVSAVAVLLEFIICKYTQKKIIAYILPVILFTVAVVMLIASKLVLLQGMTDLALIVLSMPLFFSAIITCLSVYIFKRKK